MSVNRAQSLRQNMTVAERRLWAQIRRRQLNGVRFRRQVPIGRYVVDFCCLERRLIIEVDGGQHARQIAHDRQRTGWLESQGFRVFRFWNNDILENLEGVLLEIQQAASEGEGEAR